MTQPQNNLSIYARGMQRATPPQGPSRPALEILYSRLAQRKYKASVVATMCYSIAFSMGVVYWVEAAVQGEWQGAAAFWGVLFLMLGIFLYCRIRSYSLSYREYFNLPDSSTSTGKPRCIYCGHVGMYTHGRYQSDQTFHDCSKCGQTLYTS